MASMVRVAQVVGSVLALLLLAQTFAATELEGGVWREKGEGFSVISKVNKIHKHKQTQPSLDIVDVIENIAQGYGSDDPENSTDLDNFGCRQCACWNTTCGAQCATNPAYNLKCSYCHRNNNSANCFSCHDRPHIGDRDQAIRPCRIPEDSTVWNGCERCHDECGDRLVISKVHKKKKKKIHKHLAEYDDDNDDSKSKVHPVFGDDSNSKVHPVFGPPVVGMCYNLRQVGTACSPICYNPETGNRTGLNTDSEPIICSKMCQPQATLKITDQNERHRLNLTSSKSKGKIRVKCNLVKIVTCSPTKHHKSQDKDDDDDDDDKELGEEEEDDDDGRRKGKEKGIERDRFRSLHDSENRTKEEEDDDDGRQEGKEKGKEKGKGKDRYRSLHDSENICLENPDQCYTMQTCTVTKKVSCLDYKEHGKQWNELPPNGGLCDPRLCTTIAMTS